MKSLHFCTPKMLAKIESLRTETYKTLTTIRTGWIPQLYKEDIINLINFHTKDVIATAKVLSVTPIQVQFLDLEDELIWEELERYNKKFHPEQYFFKILLLIQEFTEKKEVER